MSISNNILDKLKADKKRTVADKPLTFIEALKCLSELKDKSELENCLEADSAGAINGLLGRFNSNIAPRKGKPTYILSAAELDEVITFLEVINSNFAKNALIPPPSIDLMLSKVKSMKEPRVELKKIAEMKKVKEKEAVLLDRALLKDKGPLLVLLDTNIYARSFGPRKISLKEKSKVAKLFDTELNKGLYYDITTSDRFRHLITDASVIECGGAKYDDYCLGVEKKKQHEADSHLQAVLLLSKTQDLGNPIFEKRKDLQISCEHFSRLVRPEKHFKERSNLRIQDLTQLMKSVSAEDILNDIKQRPSLWDGKIAKQRINRKSIQEILSNEIKAFEERHYNIGNLGLGDMMYAFNAMVYDVPIITENRDMIRQLQNSDFLIIRYLFSKVSIIVPDCTKDDIDTIQAQVEQHYLRRQTKERLADVAPFRAKLCAIKGIGEVKDKDEQLQQRLLVQFLKDSVPKVPLSESELPDLDLEDETDVLTARLEKLLDTSAKKKDPAPQLMLQNMLTFSFGAAPKAVAGRRGSLRQEDLSLPPLTRSKTDPITVSC